MNRIDMIDESELTTEEISTLMAAWAAIEVDRAAQTAELRQKLQEAEAPHLWAKAKIEAILKRWIEFHGRGYLPDSGYTRVTYRHAHERTTWPKEKMEDFAISLPDEVRERFLALASRKAVKASLSVSLRDDVERVIESLQEHEYELAAEALETYKIAAGGLPAS